MTLTPRSTAITSCTGHRGEGTEPSEMDVPTFSIKRPRPSVQDWTTPALSTFRPKTGAVMTS